MCPRQPHKSLPPLYIPYSYPLSKNMNTSFTLSLFAFFSGFILMAYEIVGARLVGPYLGSSVYIWTSIIGVIMVSLSVGYIIGGRRADTHATTHTVAQLYLWIAVAITLTILTATSVLVMLSYSSLDLRLAPLIASIILFAPASILLGIVHPIITKLNVTALESAGRSVAHINALSTIGSIIGTFAAGYIFIPLLGTKETLFLLALCAIILAALEPARTLRGASAGLALLLACILVGIIAIAQIQKQGGFHAYETLYATAHIYDYTEKDTGKSIRQLTIDGNNSSSQYIDAYDLRQNYLSFYHYLANHYAKKQDKTLLLGGAGYIYPSYFARAFPERTMHVVEIDTALTQIAAQHFDTALYTHPNLTIIHEDARAYLTRTQEKYDVILGDVFRSNLTIPFHLTTQEAITTKYNALTEDGIIIENIGGSLTGKANDTVRAIYTTYKSIFPTVHLYFANDPNDTDRLQNIMLVASKSDHPETGYITDPATAEALTHRWDGEVAPGMLLTDNHAPVAYLTAKTW